jgi:hypothetical protein
VHSNILSLQRSPVGQSTWNPGLLCQNSSGIPEINMKTQKDPAVRVSELQSYNAEKNYSTGRNMLRVTDRRSHPNYDGSRFETQAETVTAYQPQSTNGSYSV